MADGKAVACPLLVGSSLKKGKTERTLKLLKINPELMLLLALLGLCLYCV